MKFSARRSEDIEINVTSLIDVVLLLLIFFMVSTRFVDQSQLKVTLPQSNAEVSNKAPSVVEVSISRNQHVYIAGKAVVNDQIQTLKQALLEAAARLEEPTVVISADRDTNFQRVIDVMDAASQAGLSHVSFPTKVRDAE